MSDALETVSATAPNLEVGIRIELITSQCYGFAIHPLTIRATNQFLFTTADRFYASCYSGFPYYSWPYHPLGM